MRTGSKLSMGITILLLWCISATPSQAQSNDAYHLRGDLYAGGGRLESADYIIPQSILGALAAGRSENNSYILVGGTLGSTTSPRHVSLVPVTTGCCPQVEVRIDSAEAVAGMDIAMAYAEPWLEPTAIHLSSTTQGFTLSSNLEVPGQIRLSMARSTSVAMEGEATLLYIDFAANAGIPAQGDLASLSPEFVRLYDEMTLPIPTVHSGCQFEVRVLFGDVNCDGLIQADDASTILRHIVGLTELDACKHVSADVTGDSTISALDAALILMRSVDDTFVFPVQSPAAPILGSIASNAHSFDLRNQPMKPGSVARIPLSAAPVASPIAGRFVLDYPSESLQIRMLASQKPTKPTQILSHEIEAGKTQIVFASGDPTPSIELEVQVATDAQIGHHLPVSLKELQLHESAVVSELVFYVEVLPTQTALLPNYPNPFNPETWIPYHLAESGDVTIAIHDANGTLVQQIRLGWQSPGAYTTSARSAHWDGRNQSGECVASGVYYCTLQTPSFSATRRMLILK